MIGAASPSHPLAGRYIADDPSTWSVQAASGFIIGLDVGLSQDHSALVVGGVWPQANGAVGITHIERIQLGWPLLEVAERTAVLARKFSAKIVLDLSNQSAFAQLLAPMLGEKPHNRLICAVITGAATHASSPVPMAISIAGKPTALPRWTLSKRELVEAIQVELENKSLRLSRVGDWEALREELSKLQREARQSGSVSYAAPPGQHDDIVSALSLCLFGCRRLITGSKSGGRSARPRQEPPPARGWT